MTNQEMRDGLTAKGWVVQGTENLTETVQRKSYWKSTDAAKIAITLELVEDLTDANYTPLLFIYSERDRWIPIKLEDLT